MFCHEQAFAHQEKLLATLHERVRGFTPVQVPTEAVSVQDAVEPICSIASC